MQNFYRYILMFSFLLLDEEEYEEKSSSSKLAINATGLIITGTGMRGY